MRSRTVFVVVAFSGLAAWLNGCAPSQSQPRPAAPPTSQGAVEVSAPPTPARVFTDADLSALQNGWVEVLASGIELGAQLEFGEQVIAQTTWEGVESTGYAGREGGQSLTLSFRNQGEDKPFAVYYLAPWQFLYARVCSCPSARLTEPLLGVTEQAVIFGPSGDGAAGKSLEDRRNKVAQIVARAAELEENRREVVQPAQCKIPEDIRVIALEVYPNYAGMQVALPGSRLAPDSELAALFPRRLLLFSLVPDLGPVTRRWIPPARIAYEPLGLGGCASPSDPASSADGVYFETSQKLSTLFRDALQRAVSERLGEAARSEIAAQQRDALRQIIASCSPCQDKNCKFSRAVLQKAESRLARWLYVRYPE